MMNDMVLILEYDSILNNGTRERIKKEIIDKYNNLGYAVEVVILEAGMTLKHIEYGETYEEIFNWDDFIPSTSSFSL